MMNIRLNKYVRSSSKLVMMLVVAMAWVITDEKAIALADEDSESERMSDAVERIKAINEKHKGLRMVIASSGWGIDAQIADELKKAGLEVLVYPDAPDISMVHGNEHMFSNSDARLYNILVFGDNFYGTSQPDPNTGAMPENIRNQIPALRNFLQEGGGIWFSGLSIWDYGRSAIVMNYILKELGLDAEVVNEVVSDSVGTISFEFQSYNWFYAWAEIMPDALTKGLKGLWHPSGIIGNIGSMGVVPITRLSSDWRVLVRGMSTSASYQCDLNSPEGSKLLNSTGTVKSSPVLCAVRQVGKGRVVLWPTWSNFTVIGGSGGMLLDSKRNGRRSDGAMLIENLLCWLVEPSQDSKTIGQFDPEKDRVLPPQYNVDQELKSWSQPGRMDYGNQYKGLIGVHSNLSDGKSSPEEMIDAAKNAGYDFIAFTEDLIKMNEEKWNKLLTICDNNNNQGGVVLVNAPHKMWESQQKFSEPISVEFSGVYLAQLPKSDNNHLGLLSQSLIGDGVSWVFLKAPNVLTVCRKYGGKYYWLEPNSTISLDPEGPLGNIANKENSINLRIDWWPGEKVIYYLNGEPVAEFTKYVPNEAVPVGVRDESVGFRMNSIKVTNLDIERKNILFCNFTKDRQFDTDKIWKLSENPGEAGGAPVIRSEVKFIAYPGLDFLDEAGNRGVVFGQRYWIKDDWWSKDKPGRIKYWHAFSYSADASPRNWFPRVIIRSKTNNKRPWNQGLWSFFSPYCYEAGKLVDDSFSEWRQLIGPHVFFMNVGIIAVHTVHSANEITASAEKKLFQTYIRSGGISDILERIRGHVGGEVCYFPSYISSGPEILDFKIYAVCPGWEGIDCAIPGNDRGLLHILVKSETGLKDVSVYDGEHLVRRFMPEGNEFETFMTFHPDSYHAYSLVVTDKEGHQAVSWPAWVQVQESVHRRSGDNWNWMYTGKYNMGYIDIPLKPEFSLLEITSGWTSKTMEEKKVVARPTYICEQGYYGHGGLSAATNGYISPDGLLVEGKSWHASGYPATTMDFTTLGRYGAIVTNTVREDYIVKKPDPYTIGCYAGPYKVVSSPWPADLKQYIIHSRAKGAKINRYQGKVTFTRKISTLDARAVRVSLGVGDRGLANTFEVMNLDGTSEQKHVNDSTLNGNIPVNGYICWYDEKGDGIGGIIALSPGIEYSYSRRYQYCFISVPSPVKPGTEVNWDVLFVTGGIETSNSNSQMEDIRLGLGIGGKPTLYSVKPKIGKVIDQTFFLTLKTEDYGFSGSVVKTTDKLLPIHLPAFIKGLNPRWDAGIWYCGKTNLEFVNYYRPLWGGESWNVVTGYEPRVDEVQYIPVSDDGVGYCQVDTDKQDSDVFIGNLLVCNQPDVFITVIKAEKGKCIFEVNNPTDKRLKCIVRPSKGFDLTGKWQKEVVLAAGGQQKFEVEM